MIGRVGPVLVLGQEPLELGGQLVGGGHGLPVGQQAAVDAAVGLLADGETMPTADELAAQFERFLAENQDRTDPPDH